MVVRIPATLVALALGLVLNLGTFWLARMPAFAALPIALLPLWSALSGFVAGRYSTRPAPAPGFAVGMLLIATQIGLASGSAPALRPYIETELILIQVIAAITGGLIGTLLARRISQVDAPAETKLTALS